MIAAQQRPQNIPGLGPTSEPLIDVTRGAVSDAPMSSNGKAAACPPRAHGTQHAFWDCILYDVHCCVVSPEIGALFATRENQFHRGKGPEAHRLQRGTSSVGDSTTLWDPGSLISIPAPTVRYLQTVP